MANDDHLAILKAGVPNWNRWRKEHPEIVPDLAGAKLRKVELQSINLEGAVLTEARLGHANISGANLTDAKLDRIYATHATFKNSVFVRASMVKANLASSNLSYAKLNRAILTDANLKGANCCTSYFNYSDLSGANLSSADVTACNLRFANLRRARMRNTRMSGSILTRADLTDADLTGASLDHTYLKSVNFTGAKVNEADFESATMLGAMLSRLDLATAKGIASIRHWGPSSIDLSTLYASGLHLPADFLLGCGVPNELLTYLPSLIEAGRSIQFYSCFISYSHRDEEFARRLYSRMRDAHIRVWFAPADVKGGEKLFDQIDSAIKLHDKILIVLSESSMQSEWVMTEIRKARKAEARQNRRKLFPIRLVDFSTIGEWECFDVDTGKDLAVEVREYFIPDFSDWKNYDPFEIAFGKLVHDLKLAP